MFTLPLKHDEAIILVAENESILEASIHSLFVFYPFDVLWLNNRKEVVDKRTSVFPFMPFLRPRSPAKYVVELRRGKAQNIVLGSTVEF